MQSRREFLRAALASSSLAFCAGAAESSRQPVPIIDTHTHFYDPTRPQGVPWPDKSDQLLYRKVLPGDYKALKKPQPVRGTVVVEASSWTEDNQWVLDLAAKEPFIVGLVGNLPAGTSDFSSLLKRFTSNRKFRGIRLGEGTIRQRAGADLDRDLKSLAAAGLALDLLGGPSLLTEAARIGREIPELRIVIDHVGNPQFDGKKISAIWLGGMKQAAAARNCWCKVSGLVEATGRTDGSAPVDAQFYRPLLDPLWELFGPDRLIYGSNWPVSARFAPLAGVQQLAWDYFSSKPGEALEKVFHRNASAAYRV